MGAVNVMFLLVRCRHASVSQERRLTSPYAYDDYYAELRPGV